MPRNESPAKETGKRDGYERGKSRRKRGRGMSTFFGYRFSAGGETAGEDETQVESKIRGDASKRRNVGTSRRRNSRRRNVEMSGHQDDGAGSLGQRGQPGAESTVTFAPEARSHRRLPSVAGGGTRPRSHDATMPRCLDASMPRCLDAYSSTRSHFTSTTFVSPGTMPRSCISKTMWSSSTKR
jgi:hypothetical protein